MCKYMNIQPYGTDAYLRYSLRTKLSWYTLLDFKPLSRAGLWTFALFVVLEAPFWSVVQQLGLALVWVNALPVDGHATLMEYMYAECGKLVLKTKCLGT